VRKKTSSLSIHVRPYIKACSKENPSSLEEAQGREIVAMIQEREED
jgi:hypothetical protein